MTLYGNVDIGYGSAKTQNGNGSAVEKTSGVMDGVHMPNCIGFRGTEDLGGGLRAGFVLEQGISPTSADGFNVRAGSSAHQVPAGGAFVRTNNRASNIWLGGGFGEVRIGTMNRATYTVVSRAIVLAENYGSEQHGLIATTRTTAIQYQSPTMNGVTVQVQHGAPHGARTDRESPADAADGFRRNKETITAINLQYSQGPFYLGAAYESTKNLKTGNSTVLGTLNNATAGGAAINVPTATNLYGATVSNGTSVAARTEKAWALAAQYDLGVARVNLTHGNRDNGGTSGTGGTLSEITATGYSIAVPMGALTLSLHGVQAETKTAGAKTADVKGWAVGAKYDLSKRTYAYAWNGQDKDRLGSATSTSSLIAKRTRTMVGVGHAF
ncbi:MAG: porin [Betaproteobacteria bacterium]